MEIQELKPCPFCGYENIKIDTDCYISFVYCMNCEFRTEGIYESRENRKEYPDRLKNKLITLWNK